MKTALNYYSIDYKLFSTGAFTSFLDQSKLDKIKTTELAWLFCIPPNVLDHRFAREPDNSSSVQ